MTHAPRTARLAPVAAALLIASGCGTSSSPNQSPAVALSSTQVKSALLTASDVGSTFSKTPSVHPSQDPGCIAKLNDVQDTGETPTAQGEIRFRSSEGTITPQLRNSVSTYNTTADAEHQLDYVSTVAGTCQRVHDDTDGSKMTLTLDISKKPTLSGVDAQTTISVTGFSQQEDVKAPIALHLSVARLGNDVMTFSYLDHIKDATAKATPLAAAAYTRFQKAVDAAH